MKILHLFNQANVPGTLCTELNKIPGIEAECHVPLANHHEGFNATTHDCDATNMLWNHLKKNMGDSDIIHIHASFQAARFIKDAFPDKKILLHFHGSDIRLNQPNNIQHGIYSANRILYSTQDLLQHINKYKCVWPPMWLPNPVDRDIFKPIHPYCDERENTIVYLRPETDEEYAVKKVIPFVEKETGLNVKVINRKDNWIPYSQMSTFLNKYKYYLADLFGSGRGVLSLTAMQMLATGGTVFSTSMEQCTKGEIDKYTTFPEFHDSKKVIKQLLEVYKSL